MIIQFTVSNFLSFKNEVNINLISSSYSELNEHKIKTELSKPEYILRSSAIYGGNASGKTNLIKALSFMKEMIVRGTYGKQAIQVEPFLLSDATLSKPSEFNIDLLINGVIYNYGFILDKRKIYEEWLFDITKKNEKRLFERITNDKGEVIIEHDNLITDLDSNEIVNLISKTTRPNQLFVKEAFEKNVESIEPIMSWFKDTLEIIPAVSQYSNLTPRAIQERDFIDFISNFVSKVDTGIKEIKTKKEKIDIDQEFSDLPIQFREDLKIDLDDEENAAVIGRESFQTFISKEKGDFFKTTLKMIHYSKDLSIPKEFDIQQESEGTQRLMHLLPILVDLQSQNKVVIIDELDRRMHPKLTRTFLEAFYSLSINNSNSQMIFTTHDTNLMDLDLIRRDEIWFFNKQENGESRLKSLAQFKVRKDKKVDRGYLNGRYSGLPFIEKEAVDLL